jgi:hypothetical protein
MLQTSAVPGILRLSCYAHPPVRLNGDLYLPGIFVRQRLLVRVSVLQHQCEIEPTHGPPILKY